VYLGQLARVLLLVCFGVTRERIRQIEAKALARLKLPAGDLRSFL
jgi:DNA-directed RNA polymerase sigma subunit (sigma70/sigma32)